MRTPEAIEKIRELYVFLSEQNCAWRRLRAHPLIPAIDFGPNPGGSSLGPKSKMTWWRLNLEHLSLVQYKYLPFPFTQGRNSPPPFIIRPNLRKERSVNAIQRAPVRLLSVGPCNRCPHVLHSSPLPDSLVRRAVLWLTCVLFALASPPSKLLFVYWTYASLSCSSSSPVPYLVVTFCVKPTAATELETLSSKFMLC